MNISISLTSKSPLMSHTNMRHLPPSVCQAERVLFFLESAMCVWCLMTLASRSPWSLDWLMLMYFWCFASFFLPADCPNNSSIQYKSKIFRWCGLVHGKQFFRWRDHSTSNQKGWNVQAYYRMYSKYLSVAGGYLVFFGQTPIS